jgi:hypothetical protein
MRGAADNWWRQIEQSPQCRFQEPMKFKRTDPPIWDRLLPGLTHILDQCMYILE